MTRVSWWRPARRARHRRSLKQRLMAWNERTAATMPPVRQLPLKRKAAS